MGAYQKAIFNERYFLLRPHSYVLPLMSLHSLQNDKPAIKTAFI